MYVRWLGWFVTHQTMILVDENFTTLNRFWYRNLTIHCPVLLFCAKKLCSDWCITTRTHNRLIFCWCTDFDFELCLDSSRNWLNEKTCTEWWRGSKPGHGRCHSPTIKLLPWLAKIKPYDSNLHFLLWISV